MSRKKRASIAFTSFTNTNVTMMNRLTKKSRQASSNVSLKGFQKAVKILPKKLFENFKIRGNFAGRILRKLVMG